jgi:hypothetical protein
MAAAIQPERTPPHHEYAPHGCSPECDLDDLNRRKGLAQTVHKRHEVDVERRNVIQARPQAEIATHHSFGQSDVGGCVESGIGLQEWVIAQFTEDDEFQSEDAHERAEQGLQFRSSAV